MAKQLRNFRIKCTRREGSGPAYRDGEWLFDKLNAERPGRERALEPKQAFWMAGAGGDDTPVLVNLKKKATLTFVKQALAQAVDPDYIYSVDLVETAEKGEKFVPGDREAKGRCRSTIEREAAGAGGESPATFVLVDASQRTTYSYDGQGGVSRLSRELRDPFVDAGSTADSLQGLEAVVSPARGALQEEDTPTSGSKRANTSAQDCHGDRPKGGKTSKCSRCGGASAAEASPNAPKRSPPLLQLFNGAEDATSATGPSPKGAQAGDKTRPQINSARSRAVSRSISAKFGLVSELKEKGVINERQKGVLKDLIMGLDPEANAALDLYGDGNTSEIMTLIGKGSLDGCEDLIFEDDLGLGTMMIGTSDEEDSSQHESIGPMPAYPDDFGMI